MPISSTIRSGRDDPDALGIDNTVGAVNYDVNPYADDGVHEATSSTISGAVDQQVDFMQYYGHGAAVTWGYRYNIPFTSLHYHEGSTMPLVFAMACETARNAPNPPWYNYWSINNQSVGFSLLDYAAGPVPADRIPDPNPLQPSYFLDDTMARHFTSTEAGGAMVYIGETVVTAEKYDLLRQLYAAIGKAYSVHTTIGDIWMSATKGVKNPEFWALIGDPSTFYVGN